MRNSAFKLLLTQTRMASSAKKLKLSAPSTSSENKTKIDDFMNQIQKRREETAESILKFNFNKKRVRIISQEQMVADGCEGKEFSLLVT